VNRPAEPIAAELLASCLTAARHHLTRQGADRSLAPAVAVAGAGWALLQALIARDDMDDADVGEAMTAGLADVLGLILSQSPPDQWPAILQALVDKLLKSAADHRAGNPVAGDAPRRTVN
jgi:hypothetical protein